MANVTIRLRQPIVFNIGMKDIHNDLPLSRRYLHPWFKFAKMAMGENRYIVMLLEKIT